MGKSIGRRPIHQSENQTGLERGKTMREKILQAIRKNEIQTYSVTEKTTEGAELYFIKKDLDMRRMKQDAVSAVTIYRDFEADGKKMRGSANINIFPEMTQEEEIDTRHLLYLVFLEKVLRNKAFLPRK